MKWNEEVIACVAKRFRAVSKQRTRNGIFGLGRAKNKWDEKTALSFHFSPGRQNRNSRSSVIFLCSETTRKRLLRRLKKPGPQACKQAPWGRAPKSSPESLLKGLSEELWSFRPDVSRFARWQTKLYRTAYQICFLIKLDSIAAIA